MFIFRILDFVFRLFATVTLVLILQISVGDRTLEDYLMSFIHTSDSLAPVRDIAYSSVRRINPNVQIKEMEKRAPASTPSSGQSPFGLKTGMVGDILKTVLLQYQNVLKNVLQSSQTVEIQSVNATKELEKITGLKKEKELSSVPAKEAPQKEKSVTK